MRRDKKKDRLSPVHAIRLAGQQWVGGDYCTPDIYIIGSLSGNFNFFYSDSVICASILRFML